MANQGVTTESDRAVWLDDPDLFMAMDDLELAAAGIVEGALHGVHRSPYLGFSVEFDAHREYQPGDDLRYVNWNLWARTERLYVKQFKSDTNLNLYLILDASASMCCANGLSSKWRYAARAAAALSYLSLQSRDAAGVTLLGHRVLDHVPPRVRPGQFNEIVSLLSRCEPRGTTDFATAMEEALHLCGRRGIVMVLSDFFADDQAVFRALADFRYYGHEVIACQILDSWESRLPEHGQFEFHDLETDERLRTNAPAVRDAVHRQISQWRRTLARFCADSGIGWLDCTTTDPLREVLIDFLIRRAGAD